MSEPKDDLNVALLALAQDPAMRAGQFKKVGGSQSDIWNRQVLQQTWDATPVRSPQDADAVYRQVANTMTALAGINPRDELEGMLAAQIVAAHHAAMDCFRQANDLRLSPERRQDALNMANKLARTWTMLLEALNRHRGKGQQKVTVEHVHVHAGGQAVVGNVELPAARPTGAAEQQSPKAPPASPTGRGGEKLEDQPYAKAIDSAADAPKPPLRGKIPNRAPAPCAGDAERTVPHARRPIDGSA